MIRPRGLVLFMGLVVSGVLSSVAVGASSPSAAALVEPVEADSQAVADAAAFRQVFGLRSDSGYVTSTLDSPTTFPNTDWSVPLSLDEAQDLYRRLAVQDSLKDAQAFAIAQADYAGVYIDQLNEGMPMFLFASANDYGASLSARLPTGVSFTTVQVDQSLSGLERAKAAVSSARPSFAELGIRVISVSVDVVENRVAVGVLQPSQGDIARIVERFPGVVVDSVEPTVADSCDIHDCLPMKAGLSMQNEFGFQCTTGYLGKQTFANGNPARFVAVTAGHCVHVGPSSSSWFHPDSSSTSIGTEVQGQHGFHDQSLADVGFIPLTSSATPSVLNKILVDPSAGTVDYVADWTSFTYQNVGNQVCRIGAGSYDRHHNPGDPLQNHYTGRQCGTIKLYNSDSDDPTFETPINNYNSYSCINNDALCNYIQSMKVVDFDSTGGDSGGSVFEKESAGSNQINLYGTHVHSQHDTATSNRGWYSTYAYGSTALSLLGADISLCATNTC